MDTMNDGQDGDNEQWGSGPKQHATYCLGYQV